MSFVVGGTTLTKKKFGRSKTFMAGKDLVVGAGNLFLVENALSDTSKNDIDCPQPAAQ